MVNGEWRLVSQDIKNDSRQEKSNINSSNAVSIKLEYQSQISPGDSLYVDVFSIPTVDKDSVYLTTQNIYTRNVSVEGIVSYQEIDNTGFIIAIDRYTGKTLWKNNISTYTGVPGDNSRSAPAIHGDFLFIGTSLELPQTLLPYTDVININNETPAHTSGTPPSVLAINKRT